MAALWRLVSSSVVPCSLKFVRPATASRLFNTNANGNYENDDDGNHRSIRPVSRSRGDSLLDIFYPLTPTGSLKEALNFIDEVFEDFLVPLIQSVTLPRFRRGWNVEEKDGVLYLRIEFMGMSREEVKLALEHFKRMISLRAKPDEKLYLTHEMKAEMKNSVLTIMLPKVKIRVKGVKDVMSDLFEKWRKEKNRTE